MAFMVFRSLPRFDNRDGICGSRYEPCSKVTPNRAEAEEWAKMLREMEHEQSEAYYVVKPVREVPNLGGSRVVFRAGERVITSLCFDDKETPRKGTVLLYDGVALNAKVRTDEGDVIWLDVTTLTRLQVEF